MDKFVLFSRYTGAKQSEIVIADYTLSYQKVIVSGGLNIFPKWSDKDQHSFIYTAYPKGIPTLYKLYIYKNKRVRLLSDSGMAICSDVSRNGNKILVTLTKDSQPDIYEFNIKTDKLTRLTTYSGIDVNAGYINDDKGIVFVSDRLSYPNIFSKKIGNKTIERLVYFGKNNSSCSTFNDKIVYASKESKSQFGGSNFNLYLISIQDDSIKKLTATGVNQFAKFSADGETILHTKRYKGRSYVGIIRLKHNRSFLFPLKVGKLQSIDW
jgi:TolB protein